jgi:hypothetical protein
MEYSSQMVPWIMINNPSQCRLFAFTNNGSVFVCCGQRMKSNKNRVPLWEIVCTNLTNPIEKRTKKVHIGGPDILK